MLFQNIMQESVDVLEKTLTISKDRIKRANYKFEYGQGTMLDVLNAQGWNLKNWRLHFG